MWWAGFFASGFDLTHATTPTLPPGIMEEYIKPILSQGGVCGLFLVLGYFLIHKRLAAVEEAIRVMVEAKLLSLAASPGVSPEVKAEAASLIERNSEALKALHK